MIVVGYVYSCYDCSEGGFVIVLVEMVFVGGFGVEFDLDKVLVDMVIW